MGLDPYPSLKFISIFIVCYGIVYLFLDKLAKMFLQSLEGKVSPFIYVVLIISWVLHLISMPLDAATGALTKMLTKKDPADAATALPAIPGMPPGVPDMSAAISGIMGGGGAALPVTPPVPSEFEIMIQTSGLYIFVLLIHLVLSLILFAPICQLLVVIYILYALVGSLSNIYRVACSLIFTQVPKNDDEKTFFQIVSERCEQSLYSKPNEMMGGFDNFSYLYVYRYLFMFVMLLFFSFRTIQSGVELKLLGLRTAITYINAYIFAFVAVCYFGRIYYEKYIHPDYWSEIALKPSKSNNWLIMKQHLVSGDAMKNVMASSLPAEGKKTLSI
jgi:hypothetical protein